LVKKRTKAKQKEHDKLVAKIAKKRFSYDDRTTYTNPNGEKNHAVDNEYPDIVAVKKEVVPGMGEVETAKTVSGDESKQWKKYATLDGSFYLYVPKSKVSEAEKIIKEKEIEITGLRSYEYDDDKLVIENITK
jgi:hypothetical protein